MPPRGGHFRVGPDDTRILGHELAGEIVELGDKLALARKVGADICINASKQDAISAVKVATLGRGVQLALECAGSSAGRDAERLRSPYAYQDSGMTAFSGGDHKSPGCPGISFCIRGRVRHVASYRFIAVLLSGFRNVVRCDAAARLRLYHAGNKSACVCRSIGIVRCSNPFDFAGPLAQCYGAVHHHLGRRAENTILQLMELN